MAFARRSAQAQTRRRNGGPIDRRPSQARERPAGPLALTRTYPTTAAVHRSAASPGATLMQGVPSGPNGQPLNRTSGLFTLKPQGVEKHCIGVDVNDGNLYAGQGLGPPPARPLTDHDATTTIFSRSRNRQKLLRATTTMSKRLAGAAVIAALILTGSEVRAVEDEVDRIANNFSHENLICGVYHSQVSQCIANRNPNDPLAETYRPTSTAFVERSVKVGQAIGLSEKALAARVEIAQQGMLSEIESTCTNIAVLLQQHAQQCKRLLEDGEKSFTDEMNRREAEMLRRRGR
jgi:hypothetical protein